MSMLDDANAELAQVNAAITAVYNGAQSYSEAGGGGSRSVMRPNLDALYRRKKELQFQIDRLSNGGVAVVQFRDPE